MASPRSPLKTKPRFSSSPGDENKSDLPRLSSMSKRQSLGRLPLSRVFSLNKQVEPTGSKVEEKGRKDRPSLSDPQLSTLYTECIKLATSNKVNQQNAWSLQLIDYMDEVIMKANEFKDTGAPEDVEDELALEAMAYDRQIRHAVDGIPRMNFQKASCTLDASVMIYSHRVDSVHKDTFKVLGAFNRGGGAQEEDGKDEAGENADGEVKKKKSRAHYTSTIETNLSNINVKLFDLEFQADPVFKKTSASFDQGGARGLLLNNLGNYEGCKIAFDSDIVPDGNYELYCDDAELEEAKRAKQQIDQDLQAASAAVSTNLDLSEIWQSMGKMLGGSLEESQLVNTVGQLELCPILEQFYNNFETSGDIEEPIREAKKNKAKEEESESDNEVEALGDQMAEELAIGGGEAPDELDQAFEHEEQRFQSLHLEEAEEAEESVPMMPTALAAQPVVLFSGDAHDQDVDESDDEVQQLPLVFSDQKEDLAFIDSALLKHWSGGSHWKFHGTKGSRVSQGGSGGGRQKAAFQLDFFDGIEIPESAFAKAGPRASNSLAKTTLMKADPSKFILPRDLNVSAASVQQLFCRSEIPKFQPAARTKRGKASSLLLASGDGGDDLAQNVSQLSIHDADAVGEAEMHAEEGGGFDVGDTPEESEEEDGGDPGETNVFGDFDSKLDLDLVAEPARVGKVDIKFAKFAKKVDVRQLKNSLWNGLQTKAEAKEEAPKSFQQTMNFLSTALPAPTLQNISVSYCFICLLHLCNEKNLRLVSKPETPEDVASHENSANDLGYNLGDFEICDG